jgi:serine/threonine-protein kinase
MLTGDPPHTGGSAQAILGKILLGEVTRPTKLRHTIPAHVEGTILKALERLPADRFGSAAELAGALHDTSFRHGAGVGQGTGEGHIWQRWTWGLSALAVILTGVAVWGWARSLPREVSRFYLSLPGDSGLAPRYGPSVALSPDGTKLVYVGPGEDGGYALWLKETGQLHPRLLQGTDGAFQPFFSPDGERIGFIAAHDGAARAVMITAVSGGLPTVVVDSMLRRGGASWGRDGFIYVLAEDSILRRIPATGGALTPITTLKEGENFHSWPEVLPNGRGVLFTVLRHGPYNFEDATIAVADLSTGEHRDLVLGAYARYAESGHLVVVGSEGTLSAAPFDEEKLEVTGMFTALAEGLDLPDGRGMEGGTDLALSSSGTAIYAEEPEEGGGNMALVWVERDGTERFIKRDWGYAFGSLALSPDGTRLAVSVSHDSGTTYQIWILPLDGSVPLQLTFEEAEDDFPVWTPDGREVTFNSSRSGTSQLYSKPWDGSAPAKPIPGADSWVWEGRWLPDGESILVTQIEGEESDLDLLVLRPGDGETAAGFLVTEANEHSPTISPSGDWVAYVSDETGEDEVFVRPFPGPGERRRVSQGGGQEPLWSHGGGEIFFRSPEGMMVAEVSISPTFTVHTRRVLFSDQIYSRWAIHTQYDITPDDQCFVMIRQGPGNLGRLVMVQNFFQELEERIGR